MDHNCIKDEQIWSDTSCFPVLRSYFAQGHSKDVERPLLRPKTSCNIFSLLSPIHMETFRKTFLPLEEELLDLLSLDPTSQCPVLFHSSDLFDRMKRFEQWLSSLNAHENRLATSEIGSGVARCEMSSACQTNTVVPRRQRLSDFGSFLIQKSSPVTLQPCCDYYYLHLWLQ